MFKWLFGTKKVEQKSPKAPYPLEQNVVKVITKTQMGKLSKLQLETMGRENGIELDRRKTKDKLIEQLHKKLTKKVK